MTREGLKYMPKDVVYLAKYYSMLHNITYQKSALCRFKRFSRLFLGAFLGFMVFSPLQVSASNLNTCNSVFYRADEALIQAKSLAAGKVLNLIQGPLVHRYKKDSEVQDSIQDLYELTPTNSRIEIRWKNSISSLQKSQTQDVLSYNIFSIYSSENGNSIDTGKRPKKINLELAKLLTTVLEAAKKDLAADPKINTLEIIADTVVNPGLIKLLKEFGFESAPSASLTGLMITMPGDQAYRTYPNFRTPIYRPESEIGLDWHLKLSVK